MLMFLFDRIRADVVALVVLVVLGLTGLVPREDLFGGFAGNAVISIIATMILGAGLDRTGALNRLAGWLLRRSNGNEQRLLLLTTGAASLTGTIMQNPAVMALFLPVASRLSSRTGLTLSRMLLPLASAMVGRGTDHGRQFANDPAQRPAGLRQCQHALGCGDAGTAEDVRAHAHRFGAGRRIAGVFPFLQRQVGARGWG
jgi:hypothetical protein